MADYAITSDGKSFDFDAQTDEELELSYRNTEEDFNLILVY